MAILSISLLDWFTILLSAGNHNTFRLHFLRSEQLWSKRISIALPVSLFQNLKCLENRSRNFNSQKRVGVHSYTCQKVGYRLSQDKAVRGGGLSDSLIPFWLHLEYWNRNQCQISLTQLIQFIFESVCSSLLQSFQVGRENDCLSTPTGIPGVRQDPDIETRILRTISFQDFLL